MGSPVRGDLCWRAMSTQAGMRSDVGTAREPSRKDARGQSAASLAANACDCEAGPTVARVSAALGALRTDDVDALLDRVADVLRVADLPGTARGEPPNGVSLLFTESETRQTDAPCS